MRSVVVFTYHELYSVLSATTNPTGKKIFEAGRKGRTRNRREKTRGLLTGACKKMKYMSVTDHLIALTLLTYTSIAHVSMSNMADNMFLVSSEECTRGMEPSCQS